MNHLDQLTPQQKLAIRKEQLLNCAAAERIALVQAGTELRIKFERRFFRIKWLKWLAPSQILQHGLRKTRLNDLFQHYPLFSSAASLLSLLLTAPLRTAGQRLIRQPKRLIKWGGIGGILGFVIWQRLRLRQSPNTSNVSTTSIVANNAPPAPPSVRH